MKYILLALSLLLITTASVGQSHPETIRESDFIIGKTIEIESQELSENRNLNIYLPLNYSQDSSKSYPVIYLLDGSKDEDFIHVSGMVQFGSFPWINMLPESIVVGIANVDRKRDFTYPSQNVEDQKEFPTSGKSGDFISFIQNELQPFIGASFRTTTKSTIIGQSLGGLLATEILFTKPNLFDHYIIVSPSLWWDDENLLATKPINYQSKKSIYIAGGREGPVMDRTTKALYDKLKAIQKQNTKLNYELLEDKTHGDALHIAVYHAFEKIFSNHTKE